MILDLLYKLPLEFYSISQLVNFATSFGLCLFAYFKNPKAKINQTFAFFCLTIAQWSFFYFLWLSVNSERAAEFYLRTCMLGVVFMPVVFTHFTLYFLNLKINKILMRINYAAAFIVAGTIYTPFFAHDFSKFMVFPFWGIAGILFPLHLAHFFANVAYSHMQMIRVMKNARGLLRKQVRYVVVGTMIGYLSGVINYFCWYRIAIPPVFNVLISVYVVSIAYAIIHYRLMDIKVVLLRVLVFFVIYIPILFLPFYLGNKFKYVLKGDMPEMWWVFPGILIALCSIVGLYIYRYFEAKAEKAIMAKKIEHLTTVEYFLEDVKRVRTLGELVDLVLGQTIKVIGVHYSSIYLFNDDEKSYVLKSFREKEGIEDDKLVEGEIEKENPLIKLLIRNGEPVVKEELKFKIEGARFDLYSDAVREMDRINASVIIPSFYNKELIAVIVLGEQDSLEPYTNEDVGAFRVLGINAGLAIKNALFIEDLNESHAEVLQRSTRRRMGEMADGMSHQFNNRFIAITFPAGIAKDTLQKIDIEKDPEDAIKRIENAIQAISRIEENAMRGGDIAKGLLRFTRMHKESHEKIDISRGIDIAIEMVEYKQSQFSQIKIKKDIEKKLPLTWGVLAFFQDMYFIIIDNACDAIRWRMEEDAEFKGEISVSVKYDKKGDCFNIKMSDNGIGMKPEILEKVKAAVPYITTKASSDKTGYGAGVHMLRRFVELNNGTLSYASVYGSGTTVSIRIPIQEAPLNNEAKGIGEDDDKDIDS